MVVNMSSVKIDEYDHNNKFIRKWVCLLQFMVRKKLIMRLFIPRVVFFNFNYCVTKALHSIRRKQN